MSHWSISRKLYGGVGCLAVLLLIALALGYRELSAVNDKLDTIASREVRKIELALMIDESTTAMKGDERRLLLAAYADDLSTVATARQDIASTTATVKDRLEEMDPLVVTADGKKVLQELSTTVTAWAAVNGRVQGHVLEGRAEEAWALARAEGNPLIDRTAEQAAALVGVVQANISTARADAAAARTRVTAIFIGLFVVALAMVALVTWTVRGIVVSLLRTSDTLHDGAQQVTSAATQVSGAAQSLSQAATEQAASLEETSASMEEMASMTRTNAESAGKAAELVTSAARDFDACDVALKEMVGSMAQISESSQRISKIIKTIDEIAFQTNILALNAAVEAARAGEAGMGFAVVADEVRNLAQRSAQAAKDTASLIEEAVTSAATGDERVKGLTVTITRISEQSAQVKGLVEQISQASAQQAQGVDQVAQAVQQMEKVTQTNAATAEESAAASEELNAQAESSLATVGALRALVLGAASGAGAHHAPAVHAAPRKPGRVVAMPRKAAVDPEREIPLEATGTYGSF